MENLIFLLSENRSSLAAGQFFNLLRFFGATLFVALLAWYCTKLLVGSRARMGRKSGNLSVVESVNVGGQAVVQLVRVGDKFIAIGVTKERITLLTEVDKEHINEPEPVNLTSLDTPFGKVLSRFMQPKDGQSAEDEEDSE
ncbi:MAG: flagellar biosynthetic protein FliO [Defluviitaleaceae bacterium]|nr:flagellar biosynthetic protein FliO [Defluviitaleaceae bacterium]